MCSLGPQNGNGTFQAAVNYSIGTTYVGSVALADLTGNGTAEDAYGNIATGYTGTVHFTNSVGGATLPGNYTFQSSDNGVHKFTGLKLRTKGKNVLTVSDTGNTSISGSLTVTVT
jgi:hypothetical protein